MASDEQSQPNMKYRRSFANPNILCFRYYSGRPDLRPQRSTHPPLGGAISVWV